MDARQIAGMVQEKVQDAAHRRRAFDSATVDEVSASGSMTLTIAGQETQTRRVGEGALSRWKKEAGDQVLLVRMSGQHAGVVSIGRSPYQDGDVTSGEQNIPH